MSFTQDLFTSRRNYTDGNTRVGQAGRIWYDHNTQSFRIGDGVTAGGSIISGVVVGVSGVGLSSNTTGTAQIITSNATHLAVANTIVARSATNTSNLETLYAGNITVSGNLTVLGTYTYVDETALSIEDKVITLANVNTPSNSVADGGGLILKGTSDHTILWDLANTNWTSSDNWNLAPGKTYKINNVTALTPNTVLDAATTANLAIAGTTVRIGATTGTTTVRNNLHVDGNITVTGSFPLRRDYDYLNFDTGLANPAHQEGRLFYDNTVKALSYYTEDSELTLNIGQETVMRVINLSNQTIFSGNAVYIVGASGDKPRVAKAQANNIATSQVVGLATTDITHGDTGYITLNGTVRGLNTSAFAAGDAVYLSATVAGAYTSTHADHPNYDVHLGYVTRSNANNGTIEVQIRNVAFDRIMVNGPANFEANLTVDQNLAVTGNTTVTGRLAVTGESTLASATVSDLTSGRIVLVGASGSLNDSANFAYNTGTNTLNTVNEALSGTLSVTGATTLGALTAGTTNLNSGNIATTLLVSGATTLSSTLSSGAASLASAAVAGTATIGGTLAVTGASTFTGDITAGNIDASTLDTTGAATVGGTLNAAGNLTVNTNKFTVTASTGTVYSAGDLAVAGKTTVSGGNLDVTTTTFNLAPTATDLKIGQNFGITTVRNNLDVKGDLNVDGGYITAGTTAVNVLNTNPIINAFASATTLNLGSLSGTGTTTIHNNLFLVGNLTVNGTQVTYNSAVATVQDPVLLLGGAPPAASDDNKDRGIQFSWHTGLASRVGFFGWDDSAQAFTIIPDALNIGEIFTGTPGDAVFSAVTGTTGTFSGSLTTASSFNVNGTSLNTSSTTFNLLNSTATTINFAGSVTSLAIGAVTGTTNFKHNVDIDLDLNIDGGDITTTAATFNLVNTSATTVNLAGAATSLVVGASSGTTNIRNNLDIDLDLNVDGGDITTNTGSFNLLMTNATVINAFGAASVVNLGATSGLTTVKNSLDVDGTVNVDGGTLSTNSTSFNLLNLNATNVNAFAAATNLQIGNSSGTTIIRNNVNINNSLDVDGSINVNTNLVVDGTVNIDGAVDIDNSADILVDLNVGRNLSVVGNLTIGSPGFNSTSLTFNLVNTYTSTVNAFGAATLVEIGSGSGKTSINNELEVEGLSLTTSRSTFDLLNTTATTLNFAGAATSLVVGATSGTTRIRNNLDIDGTLNLDGGNISVSTASLDVANTNATTINAFGAATALTLAATTGSTTIRNNLAVGGNLTVTGDLTVNGTVTTVNSTTLTVDDKNIELGSITTPTDTTADGGGITLRGTTQKTLNWINATGAWTSSEHINIATGKEYRINNVLMLSSTTLGTSVVNSSLTSVGTIGTGVWQGTLISPTYGGTGVNNGSRTITLGGNFATAGNFNLSLVLTAGTSITLPTTGTLATLAGSETITNKTINLANNTLTGTVAEFNSALSNGDFATIAGTETLTNKTVNLTNNTLSGTRAQFDAACSDDNFGFTGSKLSQFAATTSSELAGVITDETGTGALVFANTPTLVTPVLGVATATSINKVAITAPATAATLTIADGKTLTVSNALTFTGTDASSVAFGGGGTVAYTGNKLSAFAATSSSELAGVISDETGTGALVFANSPTLVTPTLGAASATSVSISSILTLAPLGAAPAGATAGTFAVADNAGGGWDPAAKGGGTPYPVFYDGATWHALY